jgi:hypothetical protein
VKYSTGPLADGWSLLRMIFNLVLPSWWPAAGIGVWHEDKPMASAMSTASPGV